MNKINKSTGFTLIEIIVVLIIMGVLAAIGLPNLFKNVNKSKGSEAIASFNSMKSALEGCGQKNANSDGTSNYAACSTTSLGAIGNFYYELCNNTTTDDCYNFVNGTGDSKCTATSAANGGTTGKYCLRASPGGAADTANSIVLYRKDANNVYCIGHGTYSGIC